MHEEQLSSGQMHESNANWESRLAAVWAAMDDMSEEEFRARIEGVVAELPVGSPTAAFERAASLDSIGRSDLAVPLYREALKAGLEGERRRRAVIQMSSSLRNLGHASESVELLSAERDVQSDHLDDAISAFLAMALADIGRAREALAIPLTALARHLPATSARLPTTPGGAGDAQLTLGRVSRAVRTARRESAQCAAAILDPLALPDLRTMSAPAAVLSDGTILQLVQDGRIRIDPWDPGLVQPASVDLRLGDSFRVFHNHRASAIDLRRPPENLTEEVVVPAEGSFVIHPGEFCLGRTLEWVELPDDIVARIEGKSSLGRLGLIVHATAGFCDPGWKGTLTLELNNLTRVPIKLYPGLLIAQLSFMSLDRPALRPYGSPELGSHYQGQRAATESRYQGKRAPSAPGDAEIG
jgi:dCTP deaminase